MRKNMLWIALGVGVAVLGAAVAAGPIMSDVQEPSYQLVDRQDNIEIRDYAPMIVAQVMVTGERQPAISQGFRLIADYIFGNNQPAQKVAMTAPVIQQAASDLAAGQPADNKGAKIAMTAPVIQQAAPQGGGDGDPQNSQLPNNQEGNSGNSWHVRFVMPADYTLDTLPKPNNDAVKLLPVAGRRVAVIRFAGSASDDNMTQHTTALNGFIAARQLQTLSTPTYAFYNPPWTIPPLRRNEVMVEVAK
jgi:F0F1-type ATP synthase membrane subunit c/vacuolar-type H+-ATPase subunit K